MRSHIGTHNNQCDRQQITKKNDVFNYEMSQLIIIFYMVTRKFVANCAKKKKKENVLGFAPQIPIIVSPKYT